MSTFKKLIILAFSAAVEATKLKQNLGDEMTKCNNYSAFLDSN